MYIVYFCITHCYSIIRTDCNSLIIKVDTELNVLSVDKPLVIQMATFSSIPCNQVLEAIIAPFLWNSCEQKSLLLRNWEWSGNASITEALDPSSMYHFSCNITLVPEKPKSACCLDLAWLQIYKEEDQKVKWYGVLDHITDVHLALKVSPISCVSCFVVDQPCRTQ